MGVFLQQLANALCVGSLYALLAIGYTMVYGVLRLINFAHGEIFMMAMYIVFYGIGLFMLPWYFGFTLTILITALLGVLSERLAYRPLRNAPRISVLISAIGVSYFLQNLATVVFGGRPLTFPEVPLFTDVVSLGGVKMQRLGILVPAITAVLLLALLYLIKRTKTGLAMRAVGAGPREIKNRIPYVLELVGLKGKEGSFPDQLSGGEQQRVAIARALVNNPSTIVADEPTGNLDPARSLEIMTLLERINALGTTVVVVTHEKGLVNHFDKRVITINDGMVAGDGMGRYEVVK